MTEWSSAGAGASILGDRAGARKMPDRCAMPALTPALFRKRLNRFGEMSVVGACGRGSNGGASGVARVCRISSPFPFPGGFRHVKTIGVAMIGCGGIALQNHLPGFELCPQAKVVALCDSNPEVLERAKK